MFQTHRINGNDPGTWVHAPLPIELGNLTHPERGIGIEDVEGSSESREVKQQGSLHATLSCIVCVV